MASLDPQSDSGTTPHPVVPTPLALFVTDGELRVLWATCAPAAISGAPADEPWRGQGVGEALLDHVPVGARARWESLARKTMQEWAHAGSTQPGLLETTFWRDGVERTLTVLMEPMLGPPAAGPGLLVACYEAADRSTNHDFARHTEAARLDVARQLAVTLNHEINNPLFIVSATLEDMLAETDDHEAKRRLNAALDAVWRVASAVKQLQEIRQLVTTAYVEGLSMIDLRASQEPRKPSGA